MTSRTAPHSRRAVAVLGATGAVGQEFVRLLANHPWFELTAVAASERSAGKPFAAAAHWLGTEPISPAVADMDVVACDPAKVDADVVFSALDSSVAGDVEAAFARAGKLVLSNARNYRAEPDVPLVIAEINPGHLGVLDAQRERRGWPAGGGIVTNGNCSTIVAALALAPLHERFGLERVFISTMQAISGAGYPGVPSLDILGNVIPLIEGEEDKIEFELRKFFGNLAESEIHQADIGVSAHANRVPVEHGHTVCISAALSRPCDVSDVERAIGEWRGAGEARDLPSSPERPVELATQPDRPQPRRDLNRGNGMTVTVGRVRTDPVFDVKLVASGHNIIRGAAGASVLNAELLHNCGLLPGA